MAASSNPMMQPYLLMLKYIPLLPFYGKEWVHPDYVDQLTISVIGKD